MEMAVGEEVFRAGNSGLGFPDFGPEWPFSGHSGIRNGPKLKAGKISEARKTAAPKFGGIFGAPKKLRKCHREALRALETLETQFPAVSQGPLRQGEAGERSGGREGRGEIGAAN